MDIPYGVIGCGEHAIRGHITPSIGTGLKLLGAYDPDPANAERVVDMFPHQAISFSSFEGLLNASAIQAVMIMSPDRFHPEQLQEAVFAGKHVLVDKPLAIHDSGMSIVRHALREAVRRKLVVSSCHPRRFDPPYATLKNLALDLSYEFGGLLSVYLDFSYHKPEADWKQSRSLLLDHFPHEIDYLHYLLGFAPFRAYRLADGPDHYTVAGVRNGGLTFFFSGTRRLENRTYPEEIHLRFGLCCPFPRHSFQLCSSNSGRRTMLPFA
jgi:predicted dehydrogenase